MPELMDAEDLGISLDKMDREQQGKTVEIDQEKTTSEVQRLKELATSGQVQPAIEGLLAIEKHGRVAEDIVSTKLACTTILEVNGSCRFEFSAY
jgi:hypothetical protein